MNKNLSQNQINTLLKYYNDKQLDKAEKYGLELSKEFPEDPFIWKALGVILKENSKTLESISANQKSLKINPNDAEVYNNLGFIYQEEKNYNDAEINYKKAIELNPKYFYAYNNLGNTLLKQDKITEAEDYYKKAIEFEKRNPETYNNLGIVLLKLGKIKDAKLAYEQAITIKPDYAEAYNNLGIVHLSLGLLDKAEKNYRSAIKFKSNHAEAHYNLGFCLQKLKKFDEALTEYKQALIIKPDYAAAEVLLMFLLKHMCDFDIDKKLLELSTRLGINTKSIQPFSLLSWTDNAKQHFLRSKKYIDENLKSISNNFLFKDQNLSKKIRVGFFSADFRDHAVMYLISGLFRDYDKKKFEFFLYSFGKDKSLIWHNFLRDNVDKFVDVSDFSFQEIVDISRKDNLNIAIDLMGYTQNNRLGIFKYRLAPIQINYLGYPGTIGADYFDYIIADHILIPKNRNQFYSEKIIFMPHSYQPNDNKLIVPKLNKTKNDHGLPDKGIVFCCFNQNYKIGLSEFNIWMRVLKKVDDSVLWLIESNKWAKDNIYKQAKLSNINSSRIIFANKLPHLEHLERHKHADLFLDTFNYNAHTTASDALRCSLPIITKQGDQFAARVASSLLSALGMHELITQTEDEYEQLIINCALQPSILKKINEKLSKNKNIKPLFDTNQYISDFELSLLKAQEIYSSGEKPKDIIINKTL